MSQPDLRRVGSTEKATVTFAPASLSALTMPSPERASPRRPRRDVDAEQEYYYRRKLGLRELLPAVGIGVGAGLFAFYVTRLLLQRTPLKVERRPRVRGVERTAEA